MSRPTQVDPRGLRVAAGITSVVLALALVLPTTAALVLLSAQAAMFVIAVFAGLHRSPYSIFFVKVVRPRLAPPAELEDARPPRFAQAVGLGFVAIAIIGFAAGAATVGYVATALALVAALLNAAVGFCLGCEMYLALRRFTPARA